MATMVNYRMYIHKYLETTKTGYEQNDIQDN